MRNRKAFIDLWLAEEEYRHLQAQCLASGLHATAFVRQLISDSKLRPRPPDQYAALLRELSAIGNNVNQIAYWANAQKSIREAEIVDAAVLARRAWELVKNGL